MLTLLPKKIVPFALAAALTLSAAPSRADEASSRWIAALPFGAGQIQRGDTGLGIFFAVGESLLGGATIATAASVKVLGAGLPRGPVDIVAVNAELRTLVRVNQLAFAAWAALTVAGVIEAQVNVGRRGPASRDQPSAQVSVTAAPVPGGASLGLRLAF
jgi:hypothetical protein